MDTIPQDTPQFKLCKECHSLLPATREFFTPYAKMTDGLRNTCKECRQKARRTSEILPEGHKRCTKCKHLLPATMQFFYPDSAGKFGLRGQCRVCQSPQVSYNPVPKGHKWCTQCKKAFPATPEFFHNQENGHVGLRGACKICRSMESKEYERNCSEEIKAQRKVRHRTIQHKLQRKSYALKNAERLRQYHRVYRRSHQAERTAHNHNREAQKRQVEGKLTPQQIQTKLKAQRYRCYYAACGFAKFKKCNGKYMYHLEHTVPLSRTDEGPRHDVNYVVLSCPACNMSKHDKLPHEWSEGGRLL